MQIYKVGGSVRDHLLNRPSKDLDFVVVGSTPEEMTQLGYKKVGADFPVFLDRGGREFALARVERKTAAGYHGFEVDFDSSVTLEQDLSRRDLTINAMAQRVTSFTHHKIRTFKYDDEIVDPFGGQQDLRDGTLKHVSDAFREDPVRALRISRFAARYNFKVHDQTFQLIRDMDTNGEFDALVKERVWNELQRAIMERHPEKFFMTLTDAGLLHVVLLNGNTLRLGKLSHSAITDMSLVIRLLAVGYTAAQLTELGSPSDVIKFLSVFENYEARYASFFGADITSIGIAELFKRFQVLHEDSQMGKWLIELIKFKAIVDNMPHLYRVIDPHVIKEVRSIKLPEDTDIPPRDRGDYLWEQRREPIKQCLLRHKYGK